MSPLTHRPIRALIVLLTALALLAAGAGTVSSSTAGAAPAATMLSYGKPTPITAIRSTFRSVSCVSPTFCMAGDENGRLLRFDGRTWTTSKHFAGDEGEIDSLECVSTTFCVANLEPDFGTDYRLLTYNGRSWTKSARCGYTQFGQAACVSTKLCFLFGDAGKIHEWNGTTWTVLGGRFETDVDATACASASLRLALGETGGLIRYNGSRLSTAAMRTPGPVPARAGP